MQADASIGPYSDAMTVFVQADARICPHNAKKAQVNIWGGLNQLSMGLLSKSHDANDFAGSSFAASAGSFRRARRAMA